MYSEQIKFDLEIENNFCLSILDSWVFTFKDDNFSD